jgi:hypothetical protein
MKRKSVLMCRTGLASMSGREPPEREVDALDIVYSKLMLGHKATRTLGAGARRAREREAAAKRKRDAIGVAKSVDEIPVLE